MEERVVKNICGKPGEAESGKRAAFQEGEDNRVKS